MNETLPSISGLARLGQTLTATPGTWSATPTSYRYNWFDCSGTSPFWSCHVIARTTGASYTVQSTDVNLTVRIQVQASNGSSSSTWATSKPTAVVSTPSTSTSSGPLCSPSPCTTPTDHVFFATYPDGAGGTLSWGINIYRPGNLVNDSAHKVPLVFAGIDAASGQGVSPTPSDSWIGEAASKQYVYVEVDPIPSQPSYSFPSIFHTYTPSGTIDDVPAILDMIHAVECNGSFPCQNIDTSRVYSVGSSKGAQVPLALMCDERANGVVAGFGIDSNTLVSNNSSTAPNCPALGGGCYWSAACQGTKRTSTDVIWQWGTADFSFNTGGCTYNCLETGTNSGGGTYFNGVGQLEGELAPDYLSLMGCPATPSLNQQFGTQASDGGYNTRRYFGCRDGGFGMLKIEGGAHQPEGVNGLDSPNEMWRFWSLYSG